MFFMIHYIVNELVKTNFSDIIYDSTSTPHDLILNGTSSSYLVY